MNNTKTRTLAIVAIFMAATLVVGTLATTTTTITQTAFAFSKKKGDENSRNGNTVTIQKCKQAATQSGFDNNQEQECENVICTHPGENATCVQEGARAVPTPIPTPVNKTCEQCITSLLTPQQITVTISSIANLCAALEDGSISEEQFLSVLRSPAARVSETIQAQLIECLINAGIPFEPLRGR